MREVIVAYDFGHVNGGAAQVAIAGAIGLVSRGYRVTYFSAVEPVDPALPAAGVIVESAGKEELLTSRNRIGAAIDGLHDSSIASRFRQLLLNRDPKRTIIHLHGWSKALTSSILPVAVQAQIPVVLTLHDFFAVCPNGGFYNYQQEQICNLQPMSTACCLTNCDKRSYAQKVWRVARQFQQIRNGMPSSIAQFISVSDFSARILRPYLPSAATITTVPNPIVIEKSPPAEPSKSDCVLFVGRLEKEKGGALLASAAERAGVRVLFAGSGEETNAIRQSFPNAELLGWQPRERVLELMRQARAVVLPSLWYETQGMVVLEAAAIGVASIVSDVTAAVDLVEPGRTGLLFRSGDVSDLADKLTQLKNDKLVCQLGLSAYNQYWNSPPTLSRHLDALESVYASVWERGDHHTRQSLPGQAETPA